MIQPLAFKSFKDLENVLVGSTMSSATLHLATTANPSTTAASVFILPKDIHGWWSFGFYLVVSVLSSGGLVCSGWCTIKFIRNGCKCKVSQYFFEQ